jgi:hypothetical protein
MLPIMKALFGKVSRKAEFNDQGVVPSRQKNTLNDAFDSGDPYISKPGEYLSDPSKALTHLHPSPILTKQLYGSKQGVKLVPQLRLP